MEKESEVEMQDISEIKEHGKELKKSVKPSWVKMKPDEMEKIVVELARNGESPAKIGLILRDKYGIPKSRVFGKKITQILLEKNEKYPTEKEEIGKKIASLKEHTKKNKKDHPSSRALTKKLWVLYKLERQS